MTIARSPAWSSPTIPALSFIVIVAASLFRTAVALGDATPDDKALAEQLFQDARQLMAAGNVDEACPKFAESYRLGMKLGTLLNLATCHEQQGKTATAWAEFTEASTRARTAGQEERVRYARDHADALKSRLTRVEILVSGAESGLLVKLDGKALRTAAWGTAIPVDPGEHEVEAIAPGKKPWRSMARAETGPATVRVQVPALENDDGFAMAGDRKDGSRQRVLGLALGAVGVLGLGVGAAFGLRTFTLKSERDEHCRNNACDERGLALHDAAKTSALASTLAFVGGSVALATGAVLLFTAGGGSGRTAKGAWLALAPSPHETRLTLGSAW